MNGLGVRLMGVYEQASTIVMADIDYARGVYNGTIQQGNANQINDRNARLTLMLVRIITGSYMTYLAFDSLKTLVKLPCMSAFGFLNDVLPLFLKVVVSYNLFRTSLNLTESANLDNGVVAGYCNNNPDQEQPETLSPYVAGTIFPSIWNSILLYGLSRETQQAQAL